MQKKVNYRLKSLVLQITKKNPYLGVRGVAALLKEKYAVNISKSSVNNILQAKGVEKEKGRKKHLLIYQRKEIKDCGLFLLKCVDAGVGLFDILAEELKTYLPNLRQSLLKKIITLLSFSSYLGAVIQKNISRNGFLKISDFYTYPSSKVDYFLKILEKQKPAVSLAKAKDNLKLVSTIKFIFGNGHSSYCDAKMSTFWDATCRVSSFSFPICFVKRKLSQMIEDKVIMVYYTKSFDYLSPLVISFIDNLTSGIKKIELLNEEGGVIDKQDYEALKPSFLIGYYPKILAKGISFLEKEGRFKRLTSLEEQILYTGILTKFIQPEGKKPVTLNSVFIKVRENSLPVWGILTDIKANLGYFLKKYFLLWPYREKVFLEEMKTIENFFLVQEEKKDLSELIPKTLSLEKEEDFGKFAELLAAIFKKEIGDLEFKGNSGKYLRGKDFYKITIENIPQPIKKKFNNACLFLDNKRVFLT